MKRSMKQTLKRAGRFLVLAAAFGAPALRAEVRLANSFGDNMVLQRDQPVPVWGWAAPGERVTVAFAGQTPSAVANADGRWQVTLAPLKVSAVPGTLAATGTNTVTAKNVLVGDVWLCSGQSNMEMPVAGLISAQEQAGAGNPLIRHMKVPGKSDSLPHPDIEKTRWDVCTSQTVAGFTAAGYFFAREVQRETGLPLGVINCAAGGSMIDQWIPADTFATIPEIAPLMRWVDAYNPKTPQGRENYARFTAQMKDWVAAAEAAQARGACPPPVPEQPGAASHPSKLYNAMAYPLVGFGIKGVLWYQGENHQREGVRHHHKLRALTSGWRDAWNQANPVTGLARTFPFYWVQLPNFKQPDRSRPEWNGEDDWPGLREGQRRALALTNVGMAVTIDLGDAADVHPRNKQDVGKRLALWALAKTYGKDLKVWSGPLYRSHAVEGGRIRIAFEQAGSGLMAGAKQGLEPAREVKDRGIQWFAVAGDDKVWRWADAVIEGDTVVVSSPAVAKPVAVRYAVVMNPTAPLLYNREGLPATPFRTDDW